MTVVFVDHSLKANMCMDKVETFFRSVKLTIVNSSRYTMNLMKLTLTRPAIWAPDQAPQPSQEIRSGDSAIWRAQTSVVRTRVEGSVEFAIPQGGTLRMYWKLPWVERFEYRLQRLNWSDTS